MSRKILIITPDFNLGVMIEARLDVEDYTIFFTHDGEEGLAQVRKQRPNLIILDAMLPGISSYQVIDTLKNSAETRNIPLLILSERSEFHPLFKEAGIHSFMTKPVIPVQLFKKVKAVFESEGKKSPDKEILQKTILLAGAESFILEKIKKCLEGEGYEVEIGWNQEDISKKINQTPPALFLLQFWDDPEVWDAVDLVRGLKNELRKKKIPLLVFCLESLVLEAKNNRMKVPVLTYFESPDLLTGLKNHLWSKKI